MDNLFLDGAEGLVITVFLSHIVYHFISSQVVTNGKFGPRGIRVFQWSKLGLNDKLRIFSQRVIHYQITHFLFIALSTQLPRNIYFPTIANMFMVQCFNKLRYDMYDLFAVYSQVFQNYNIIFLFSQLLRSKNGLFYQICIISTLILFRCVYVFHMIQIDNFIYYPQQFLSQGFQETLSAFITFLAMTLFEKIKSSSTIKYRENHIFIIIAIIIYTIHTILRLFYKFSSIQVIKQQWLFFLLGHIFLRPIYISVLIILFFLLNLSPTIKQILSNPLLSKLLYLPRMFQISLVCIFWQILLVSLSHMQIGPSEPVITAFIVIGFMILVQVFAVISFCLITPIILVIFAYFDVLCDDLSSKVLLVIEVFNEKIH